MLWIYLKIDIFDVFFGVSEFTIFSLDLCLNGGLIILHLFFIYKSFICISILITLALYFWLETLQKINSRIKINKNQGKLITFAVVSRT